jgi:hypothetical protein
MRKVLKEGFDYRDLVGQVEAEVSIDEYSAKMGTDDEIITLAFIIKSRLAAKDLVDWFERGYSWILDAKESDGEVSTGKFLVFVEIERRTSVPDRICEMIDDLETLTEINRDDWKVIIDDEEYPAEPETLAQHMILSPKKYREAYPDESSEDETDAQDEELSEMRNRAGLEHVNKYKEKDSLIKDYLAKAGL